MLRAAHSRRFAFAGAQMMQMMMAREILRVELLRSSPKEYRGIDGEAAKAGNSVAGST